MDLCLLQNFGSFQPLFLWVLLNPTLFFLSFRTSDDMNVKFLFYSSLRLLIFSVCLSLFFRWDHFQCSVFQLNDYFLHLFHCDPEFIYSVCDSGSYIFSVFKLSFSLNLYWLFLCWDFLFLICFRYIHNCILSCVRDGFFKNIFFSWF